MKTRKRWSIAVVVALAGSGLGASAMGQVKDHHGHSHAEVVPAKTFAEVLMRLRALANDADAAFTKGDLHAADEAGYQIGVLSRQVGRLALAQGSGVEKAKVREANLAGKDLAKAADEMHDYAAEGKKAETGKQLEEVKKQLAKLEALRPEKFICDMHCETTKTYDSAGMCPVCKMALVKLSEAPFSSTIGAAGTVTAGKPSDITITLRQPDGNPVDKIDTVHEHPLHLIFVSEDLSYYAHEHPVRRPDGVFDLKGFTFPFPGKFLAFSDFTPTGFGNRVARSDFRVAGDGGTPPALTLKEDYDVVAKVNGYEIRQRCNGEKFFVGKHSFFRYGIEKDGKPVTDLQKLMGELGHLVIISADLKDYVHAHPIELDDESEKKSDAKKDDHGHDHEHHAMSPEVEAEARKVMLANGKPSDVVFHAVLPRPGMYRLLAQFQHQGKVITVPMNVDAQMPEGGMPAAKPSGGHDHSGHGAKP
ncbi:MAG: hypothetical protein K2W85_00065 [Phycisphaerales bacterium]|nr:hypothetical protein [Phycisphaerales bacterium]